MNKLYGVWIPTKGWLSADGKVLAFADIDIARRTAKRVRQFSRAELIDESLSTPTMEKELLKNEVLPLEMIIWRILTNYSKKP